MRLISLDISGEDNGTTGVCVFNSLNDFSVLDVEQNKFDCNSNYYKYTLDLVIEQKPDIVIIENYINYKDRSKAYTNQENKTSEMLGFLEHSLKNKGIKVEKFIANQYKDLVDRDFLTKCNISTRGSSRHCKDAIKMCVFYTFWKKREENIWKN